MMFEKNTSFLHSMCNVSEWCSLSDEKVAKRLTFHKWNMTYLMSNCEFWKSYTKILLILSVLRNCEKMINLIKCFSWTV